jgi:sulfur-carrier protein
MARIVFTANLQRHIDCPVSEAEGATVREALGGVFRTNERLRGYVLDDQSTLRPHMAIVVDGKPVRDRVALSDPISAASASARSGTTLSASSGWAAAPIGRRSIRSASIPATAPR